VKDAGMEEKYSHMRDMIVSKYMLAHLETMFACGFKDFGEIQSDFDKAYKAAFGLKNDLVRRVEEYNMSQQKGAQYVKMTAIAAVGLATGGLGVTGALTAAAVGGATAAALETTDQITNVIRQSTVSNKELEEALKSLDLEKIAKTGLTTAAIMGAYAAVGKGLQFVVNKVIPIPQNATAAEMFSTMRTQSVAMSAANLVMMEGVEYIMTGEITWEGAVFAITVTAAGQILALHRISAEEKIYPTKQAREKVAGIKSELGLDNVKDSEITSEFLRQFKKAASLEFHPDKYTDGQVPEFDTRVVKFKVSDGKTYKIKIWNANLGKINSGLDLLRPYVTNNGIPYTTAVSSKGIPYQQRLTQGEQQAEIAEGTVARESVQPQEVENEPAALQKQISMTSEPSELIPITNRKA